MHPTARAAAVLLDLDVTAAEPLAGGSMEQVLLLTLGDGRRVVAKGGPSPRDEAAMLRALGAADVPVPAVLAVDAHVLVIEACTNDGDLRDAWSDLGRVVTSLHACEGDAYGWPTDYAYGRFAIANGQLDDWPRFWAERRLLAHADELPRDVARRVEALAHELTDRLPAEPRASLLHGDLWQGNVLVHDAHVSALVDPACYYGHGEVDLAMLTLFTEPGSAFYAAYEVEAGWQERRPTYTLWPALVHLVIFGDAYRPTVDGLLREAGV